MLVLLLITACTISCWMVGCRRHFHRHTHTHTHTSAHAALNVCCNEWIPGGAGDLFFKTPSVSHPASYSVCTGFFPGGKAAGAWNWPLTSIQCRAIYLLPHTRSWRDCWELSRFRRPHFIGMCWSRWFRLSTCSRMAKWIFMKFDIWVSYVKISTHLSFI